MDQHSILFQALAYFAVSTWYETAYAMTRVICITELVIISKSWGLKERYSVQFSADNYRQTVGRVLCLYENRIIWIMIVCNKTDSLSRLFSGKAVAILTQFGCFWLYPAQFSMDEELFLPFIGCILAPLSGIYQVPRLLHVFVCLFPWFWSNCAREC